MRERMAVVLLLAAALSLAGPAEALSVRGLPEWSLPLAERGLRAVWEQMPSEQADEGRVRLLRLVAERLFDGYSIGSVDILKGEPTVSFVALEPVRWKVALFAPDLSDPLDGWFDSDLEGIRASLALLLDGLPPAALSWCGRALEETVRDRIGECLPGWTSSLIFRSEEAEWTMEVRFAPQGTLLLAFDPHLVSTTLPVTLLRTDLKDNVLEGLEPLLGLPVAWLAHHRSRIESWIGEGLTDRRVVSRTAARVDVDFRPERISAVDVSVESRRYVLWAWASAYAGTADRYPEVGLHLGRRAQLFRWWEGELYYEGIVEMKDFELESRWGFRWSPWGDVWLGVETVYPGSLLWGCLSLGGRVGEPYFWGRFSEESDHNFGLGYRLTEFISLELHYDNGDEDRLSLRAIGNL
ncbi:hypothetical protein KAR29_09695 [Aminithiophilus ramosus]|uniref:Uncharacterized protein n=1 Tax=Aminithiophilus ramosus TaxID=3029084 RepID=A0A9Q7EV03_9BACT|nr:hypothetical protein [Aminithiophilus ramosus]QTX31629.1 hypothetical protein KAR29_09695 [Aminithiophilus ramosus]